MAHREDSIKEVRAFIAECRKIPVPIDRAILFGSAATGAGSETSDIDVVIFSEKFTENILYNLELIGPVNIRYPNIEVHTFPQNKNVNESWLLGEIVSKGIDVSR